MKIKETEAAIEAILFAMGGSVELPRIARAIGVDEKTTGRIIRNMMDRYQEENRGIQIIELENSFQMCTKKEYYQYLINIALHPQKPALSDVMLETLSIIAYKQPVTKAEIEKIRERFVPFLNICKAHGTAIRIGVNHGSLSDRIMSRYGDTPEGMVASCMEFLRICREENFPDVVISIKASNTVVMVRTVRLLVRTMEAENMHYPLHLGVTEAGDGEDGRIKSAVGIGTLLCCLLYTSPSPRD